MQRRRTWSLLVGLGLAATSCHDRRDAAAPTPPARALPDALPAPVGWKTETIAFPLPFAPQLPYRGVLDLRFSPGMFDPAREDFWSYAFAWWLDGPSPTTAAELDRDLKSYFEGLYGLDPTYDRAAVPVTASLAAVAGEALRFRGSLDGYDPFRTRRRIYLHLDVRVVPCHGRTAVVFELSPQPPGHPIWRSLDDVVSGVRCASVPVARTRAAGLRVDHR